VSLAPPVWRPTQALLRAGVASAVAALAAVVLGRPDLLVLAAPLLLHASVAAVRRPAGRPTARMRLEHPAIREGEATRAHVVVEDVAGGETFVLAQSRPQWTVTDPASGVATADLTGADRGGVVLGVGSQRWGRRRVGGGSFAVTSAWAGYRWGPSTLPDAWLTTLPLPGSFDSRAPAPHPLGVVGRHPARRPGEGTELHSVRPFAAGDRLRRVRWPVSLRTGTLHVTSTVAEQDSSVLLLVDNGVQVGTSGGIGGASTSLDTAVRAAGAVAEHTLRRGDRVALRVLASSRPAPVPPGTGNRHLRRVLDTLAAVTPGRTDSPVPASWQVPAGAVVLVFTPMLSDLALAATSTLARRGLSVVVVDTLPDDVPLDDERSRLAWRLRLVERRGLLLRLTRAGIPVVPWSGPGTLDEVLRRLARRSSMPRLVRR